LLFLSALENKNIMAVGSSNCWYCALQHKPSVLGHPSVEIALCHQLLQPPILRLELPQALDIARLQPPKRLRQVSIVRSLMPCRLATGVAMV
jgi:hypothetical protein